MNDTLDPSEVGAAGPARIGHYQVVRLLGRGGMGEVYEAVDTKLQRRVALKRISAAGRVRPKARARFWREARALAAIEHPGVVSVYEIAESEEGDPYIAMAFVPGTGLDTRISRPWTTPAVMQLALPLADALRAVHAAGLTHRDIKPANILVRDGGGYVLVDFGLAREVDGDAPLLTGTGAVVGTASYMAPEQAEGGEISAATDIFAVGVLLYRVLAGVHPFRRASRSATALAILAARCEPLANVAPHAPAELVAVITRCLALDPASRHADGAALYDALSALDTAEVVPGPTPQDRSPLGLAVAPPTASSTDAPSLERSSGNGIPASKASPPRRRTGRVPLLGVAGLVVAAAVVAAVVLSGGEDGPTPTSATAPVQEATALAPAVSWQLPPRPVVAVLPFGVSGGNSAALGAATADAVRVYLGQTPAQMVSLPWVAIATRRAEASAVNVVATDHWVRAEQTLGHVDVLVSGRVAVSDGRAKVSVTLVQTQGNAAPITLEVQAVADPQTLGETLARRVLVQLEQPVPTHWPTLTRSAAAYAATLQAQVAAREGEDGRVETLLREALRLDPQFPAALLESMVLARTQRRIDALGPLAEALLSRHDISARDRLMATAWSQRAAGDGAAALRTLYALVEQYPFDVVGYETLLALLQHDPNGLDAKEVERVATQVLTVAPRFKNASSRLVRSVAGQGRATEVRPLLERLHVPIDTPEYGPLRAEVAMLAGDFEVATAGWVEALEGQPEHIYFINMHIATLLLAGDCDGAVRRALTRIDRVSLRGQDENLSWTFSLANQALMCLERWPDARKLMDRWLVRDPGGISQIRWQRLATHWGEGMPRDKLVAAVQTAIAAAQVEDPKMPQAGCRLLSLLAETAEALAPCLATAREHSYDLGVRPGERRGWSRLLARMEARLALLSGETASALVAYERQVIRVAGERGNADENVEVTTMFAYADALARAGRAQTAATWWKAVRDAGYARLWLTELWALARHELSRTRP